MHCMNQSLQKLFNHTERISLLAAFIETPDASVADFNNSLEGILSTISFENKLSYLMGDFNINILNSQSHQPSNEFINLMVSNSLY